MCFSTRLSLEQHASDWIWLARPQDCLCSKWRTSLYGRLLYSYWKDSQERQVRPELDAYKTGPETNAEVWKTDSSRYKWQQL